MALPLDAIADVLVGVSSDVLPYPFALAPVSLAAVVDERPELGLKPPDPKSDTM